MRELLLRPVQEPLRRILAPGRFARDPALAAPAEQRDAARSELLGELRADAGKMLGAAAGAIGSHPDDSAVEAALAGIELAARAIWDRERPGPAPAPAEAPATISAEPSAAREGSPAAAAGSAPTAADATAADAGAADAGVAGVGATVLLAWSVLRELPGVLAGTEGDARAWVDRWALAGVLEAAFRDHGLDDGAAWRTSEAVRAMIRADPWPLAEKPLARARVISEGWFADEAARRFLQVNIHRDVAWFNREAWIDLVNWSAAAETIRIATEDQSAGLESNAGAGDSAVVAETVPALLDLAERSGYRVDELTRLASALEPLTAAASVASPGDSATTAPDAGPDDASGPRSGTPAA